ncbi:hypothetical protein EDC01DRAFT_781481 [Geopyxis carbonaria]|nr:hypothetical protein EDC01DRAFT_781481 [Geopyxis carbonaria]
MTRPIRALKKTARRQMTKQHAEVPSSPPDMPSPMDLGSPPLGETSEAGDDMEIDLPMDDNLSHDPDAMVMSTPVNQGSPEPMMASSPQNVEMTDVDLAVDCAPSSVEDACMLDASSDVEMADESTWLDMVVAWFTPVTTMCEIVPRLPKGSFDHATSLLRLGLLTQHAQDDEQLQVFKILHFFGISDAPNLPEYLVAPADLDFKPTPPQDPLVLEYDNRSDSDDSWETIPDELSGGADDGPGGDAGPEAVDDDDAAWPPLDYEFSFDSDVDGERPAVAEGSVESALPATPPAPVLLPPSVPAAGPSGTKRKASQDFEADPSPRKRHCAAFARTEAPVLLPPPVVPGPSSPLKRKAEEELPGPRRGNKRRCNEWRETGRAAIPPPPAPPAAPVAPAPHVPSVAPVPHPLSVVPSNGAIVMPHGRTRATANNGQAPPRRSVRIASKEKK